MPATAGDSVNLNFCYYDYWTDFFECVGCVRCDGVMCGHIHSADDKQIDGIHYLNSGDWVESKTAIVEHFDGRLELIKYDDFRAQLNHQIFGVDLDEIDDMEDVMIA